MSACFDLYLLEQTVTQCGRTFEPYRPQRYRPFSLSIYVNKQNFLLFRWFFAPHARTCHALAVAAHTRLRVFAYLRWASSRLNKVSS